MPNVSHICPKPSKTIKNHQKPIEFNRNFEKPGSGHFWTMKLLMFAPIGADVREVRHSHHCPKCLGYSLYALWCLLVQIRERTGEQKWSRREEKCHWDKARFPGFWKVLDGSGRLEGSSGCWFYKMFTDRNDRNAREGNNNMLLITSFVIEFWIKSRVASKFIKPTFFPPRHPSWYLMMPHHISSYLIKPSRTSSIKPAALNFTKTHCTFSNDIMIHYT